MSDVFKYLITFVCSGTFIGFLQYLINRHDSRNDKISKLQSEIEENDKSSKERDEEQLKAIEELRKAMIQSAEDSHEMKQYMVGIGETVVGLAQDKLVFLTDMYQERGYITTREQAILTAIYIPYHDKLNGNGNGKAGYEYVMNHVEVVSEEEAHKRNQQRSVSSK